MSRTDKTRSWEIQGRDQTEDGYINHACTKARGRKSPRGSHKTPTSVDVSVSIASWQECHLAAKVFFPSLFPRERDGRMHFFVTKRRNTTTAKLMQRLRAVFGEVELHIWKKEPSRVILECKEGETCKRVLRYFGGERHLGGAAGMECKFRRRKIRQRERAALYHVLAGETEDFDLLPIREDRRTIHYDLT